MKQRDADLPVIAALGATVLWSSGNILVREASLPGPQLAFFRVVVGCLIYTAVVVAFRGGRPSLAAIRISALGGVGFGLQAALYFTALKMTTLASAAVIGSLQPVMLLPVSMVLYGERPDRRRIVLVFVAIGGTVLVVLGSSSSGTWSLGGDLLALAGTAIGCCYFVGTKSARQRLGVFEYQSSALLVAAVCALPFALLVGDGLFWPTWSQWVWPFVMTATAGTGHLLMSWAQRTLSVTFTSTVSLNVLVLSVLAGAIILGEPVRPIQIVGMAVVLASLVAYIRVARVTEISEPVT